MDLMLGNGLRLKFTSKRSLNQFIAETNRFLNRGLVNINLLLSDCYREYRLMWFISSNVHKGKKTNYENIAREISENIKCCEIMLEKFGKHYWGSDDPFFSFIDMIKSARYCAAAARQMEQFHKARNNTHSLYNCQNIADRSLSMIAKLENYQTGVKEKAEI